METPPPREWGHLRDSAEFWAQAGGIVITFGGVLVATAAVSELSRAWLFAGLSIAGIGLFTTAYGVMLRLAHNHALRHMCPDPRAHDGSASPEASTAPGHVTIPIEEFKELIQERPKSAQTSNEAEG